MFAYALPVFIMLVAWPVYRLLPAMICFMSPALAQGRLRTNRSLNGHSEFLMKILPANLRKKVTSRLQQAGYSDEKSQFLYIIIVLSAIPASALIGFVTGFDARTAVLFGLSIICLVNTRVSSRIRQRRRAFNMALYKIYRFLSLQVEAGLKMTDALKGIPDAINDEVIRPSLIRFAARYELTLDFDQAFGEIRRSFPGPDSELLATHLRQGLQTGDTGRTLQRMEELMFTRYFSLMQADTQKIRHHLLLVAFIGILPASALFLLPMLSQAYTALQTIFG